MDFTFAEFFNIPKSSTQLQNYLNMKFLLVRIFEYSTWTWRFTLEIFVVSPNKGKYGPEKLRIRTFLR